MTTIHLIHVHLVGEDSSVWWMAAGTTYDEAKERLIAKIDEAMDEIDMDPAERLTHDLMDTDTWTLSHEEQQL